MTGPFKRNICHLALLIAGFTIYSPAQAANNITSPPSPEDARWHSRILIACETGNPSGSLSITDGLIEHMEWAGLAERDMFLVKVGADKKLGFWVPKNGDGTAANLNHERSHTAYAKLGGCLKTEQSLVLIGKDGGRKRRWVSVPSMRDIFDLIDAMPMRRQEMRQAD